MGLFDSNKTAQELVRLRQSTERPEGLQASLTPPDLTAAYATQDRVRELVGTALSGWKAGATAKPVQEKFAITEPFAGPFFESDTHPSPARLPAAAFTQRAIESEFAFRFARPLAPRDTPYSREDILAAIDALVPAIEIVSTRFSSLLFDKVTTAVADCALNGGFVLGVPATDWRGLELSTHKVRLMVDGREAAAGTGANVLGHPYNVLDWTVNHLRARGITIAAGEVISTGTTTGIVILEPGQSARADFGALGVVELTLE